MEMEEKLYQRVKTLENEYALAKIGRRAIVNEMLATIKDLRKCSKKYKNELDQLEGCYKLRNYYISDYKLVMNVILKLANMKEQLYGMKEITATDFMKYNDTEVKQVYGKTTVIASCDVLDDIDEKKLFYYDEFSFLASRIINEGNSMVMIAPNVFEGNVKPQSKLAKSIKHDLINGGFMGNISCFLYDNDPLKEAVMKVVDYINVNGPDFDGVDEDTLCDLIMDNDNSKRFVKK